MRDLNHQIKQHYQHYWADSYAIQWNRERILTLMANELHALDHRKMQARSLKPKHTDALINRWQDQSFSIGTMKMPHVRTALVG